MSDMSNVFSFSFENSALNLEYTLECGQCFRWKRLDDGYYWGVLGDYFGRVRQRGTTFDAEIAGDGDEATARATFDSYFGLDSAADAEYARVTQRLKTDEHITKAISRYNGLRLLRQPPYEVTISFILATNNNIPSTSRAIQAISKKYGKAIRLGRYQGYTFPTPQALAQSDEYELNGELGADYRGKFIAETTRMIVEQNFNYEQLRGLPYDWAHGQLIGFPGVGRNVADWILLFAMGMREAFPLDTWVTKAMETFYFKGQKPTPRDIRLLAATKWGDQAGYANEFLYMYARNYLK